MKVPERIEAIPSSVSRPSEGGYWSIHPRKDGGSTAYVRADLYEEAVEALKASNEWIPEDTELHAANAAVIAKAAKR